MKQAGPVCGAQAGTDTGMERFAPFIWKIVLESKIKMKSRCKTIFYGLEKT